MGVRSLLGSNGVIYGAEMPDFTQPTALTQASSTPEMSQRILDRVQVPDHTVMEDLIFLAAWEKRQVPWLSGTLRMRQLRRANPELARKEAAE